MKGRVFKLLCAFGVISLAAVMPVQANEPTEPGKLVMRTIEELRKTVNEKKGKVPVNELDRSLQDIIFPVFDFAEMSKESLGANWNKATPDEQKQFVDLFSGLLGSTYLAKVRKVDQTEITFLNESIDSNNEKATVKTNLLDKGDNVALNYRLYHRNGEWRIYDVIIENISLVNNYRSEFAGIVRKDNLSGLIVKLKEKKTEREEARAKEAA